MSEIKPFENMCSAKLSEDAYSGCKHGHTINAGCMGHGTTLPNCCDEDKEFNEKTQTVGRWYYGMIPPWRKPS